MPDLLTHWIRPNRGILSSRPWLRLALAFMLAIGHFLFLASEAANAMPSVIVNSTGDAHDSIPGDDVCDTGGTNADSLPECTLRAAIEEANAVLGTIDEIHFSIPTTDAGFSGGVYRIGPAAVLPWITQTVTVDGTTQPGFIDTPIVVLDGSLAPPSPGGTDGLLLAADDSTIRGLVVQAFDDDGIEIHGDGNTVIGNQILNNDTGVLIESADDNTVGGLSVGDRNVISGNTNSGVVVDGSDRAIIHNNYVGVDATGSTSSANVGHGIHIEAGSTDTTVGSGNVISGNTGAGIRIDEAGGTTTVIGSYIGLDAGGTSALANGASGVSVGSLPGVVHIGGSGVGEGNVISGNTDHGIDLEFGAGVAEIRSNRIGTNSSGTTAVGNGEDGIRADGDSVVIEDNLVSGNGVDGLRLERPDAVARGNLIGTAADSISAIPNGDDGIDTGSGTVGTVIGGSGGGDGNTIAFNGDNGIVLRTHAGTSATMVSNSIFSNGGLGIDLGDDGPTPNDSGDIDSGPPNGLLNHPVITSAAEADGTVYVGFDLDVPVGAYRIELFTNPTGADPTGYGEGEVHVGSVDVSHLTAGAASYSFTYPGLSGVPLSATTTSCLTTECAGFTATSEFSPVSMVVVGNYPPVLDHIGDRSVTELSLLTLDATASDPDVSDALSFSLSGGPAGAAISPTGTFTWIPTEAQGPGSYTFDVIVTDDGTPSLDDTETITVTVAETNQPPILDPVGNQNVDEGELLSWTATAIDLDDPTNELSFSLSGQPAGAVIDPYTGEFAWTPTEAQGPGSYTFDVIVTDQGTPHLNDTETITVMVSEVNRRPTVSAPGNRHDAEGDHVSFLVPAADSDIPSNTLTYSAAGLPPGLSIHAAAGVISGTIDYEASVGSPYVVSITVRDSGSPSLARTRVFVWTVDDVNRSPTFAPLAGSVVDEETTLHLTATANDPDVGDVLTFELADAPPGASIDPASGEISWTPTEAEGPGTYSLTVIVTDDRLPNLTDSLQTTVIVKEVNRPPVVVDDLVFTAEDEPVTLEVLANDSDPDIPRNSLSVTSVGQSASGVASMGGSDRLSFTPARDFTGVATFDYTVSDGSVTRRATVTIVVRPLNDVPVAVADQYRLTTFQPVRLDVLRNDRDVDGDPLALTVASMPSVGTVTVEAGELLYEPLSGWVGTVTFTYFASDPSGEHSEGTVTLVIDDDVLTGAQRLADSLGVGSVPFEAPTPNFGLPKVKSLLSMDGITLLAQAFFQTVNALRIPLSFLGLTLLVVVGFGSITRVPALLFGVHRRHWAVVLLSQQQRLPAYSEPMGRRAIYNYEPTTSGIVSTGKARKLGKTEWLPIDTPNGEAWLYREYLTEQVDLEAFMDDPRPVELVHTFVERLRKGEDVTSLLSKGGLVVALTGPPTQIPREHLADFLKGSRLRHLRLTSAADGEDFQIAVAEPFIEAYEATSEITADTPHSKTALIPAECWNFPYLALGTERGVQPWLVFFEYRNGKAWIAGLGIDE